MSFRPDTIERKLARLEKKLREQRDELFVKSRGVNANISGGIGVGTGGRGGTGSFGGMRSFIPQDITIDDLDENRVSTGNIEHITLGAGSFLRLKPPTGIAGNLKFIHGTIQDGQFLIVSPDSTQPGSTLRLLTGGNLSIANDIVLQRNEIAVLLFDDTLPLNDPDGNYMILASGSGGGAGVTCPVICDEVNLGDVTGGVEIDWSLGPFFRMRVVGDINVVMNNLPTTPGWHEITVEFLMDSVGEHDVVFLDIFRNSPVPVIRKGANRYTIVKFYSYFDQFDNILTWQPLYLTNTEEAQPAINQGMIHAILNTDQITDLAVGDHIEFRIVLFTNNMGLSSGAGQLAGIFSGFKTRRTYELTASLGGDRAFPPGGAITYQWFDIAQGQFIGTQGTLQDPGQNNPYQFVAKAFFQAFDITDTVELRITSQTTGLPPTPIDVIYSGFPSGLTNDQTPQSFAEIKDCGQTQQQFDAGLEDLLDEDTIILPSSPPIGFTANSTLFNNYFRRNPYSNVGGTIVGARVVIPFQTNSSRIFATTISLTDLQIPTGQAAAGTFGFIKKLRMKITENTLNKAIQVKFFRNGGDIGTLVTIGAGVTGSVNSSGNTPIAVGDRWSYLFETTDGLIPSGFMSWSMSTDIEWGLV